MGNSLCFGRLQRDNGWNVNRRAKAATLGTSAPAGTGPAVADQVPVAINVPNINVPNFLEDTISGEPIGDIFLTSRAIDGLPSAPAAVAVPGQRPDATEHQENLMITTINMIPGPVMDPRAYILQVRTSALTAARDCCADLATWSKKFFANNLNWTLGTCACPFPIVP
jgi:hypothetical protein